MAGRKGAGTTYTPGRSATCVTNPPVGARTTVYPDHTEHRQVRSCFGAWIDINQTFLPSEDRSNRPLIQIKPGSPKPPIATVWGRIRSKEIGWTAVKNGAMTDKTGAMTGAMQGAAWPTNRRPRAALRPLPRSSSSAKIGRSSSANARSARTRERVHQ